MSEIADIFDFNSRSRVAQFERKADDRAQQTRDELSSRAREFVEWLYDGRALIARDGKTAMIGDVYGTPGESLNIVLRGPKTGNWHDFANNSDQGSDLIGLYMAAMGYDRRRDFVKALDEIGGEFLGWAPINRPSRPERPAKERIAEATKVHGNKPKASVELGAPTASYHYYSLDGVILATVRRYDFVNAKGEPDKTFRQWDGQGRPQAPNPRPLYRLPEIVQAQTIVLVEGEKCAEALASIGIEATTAIGGANTDLAKVDWTPLAGKQITIWPDADDAGRGYASKVTPLLLALGCDVAIVPTEGHSAKWDAAKCLEEGGDVRSVLAGASSPSDKIKPRFTFETIGDLRRLPPTRWLVPGWIPEGGTGIFYGKWASGKSFIGFDLALHLAYGFGDWHGVPLSGEPCNVLVIAREGHQGFVQRIDAFKLKYGIVDDTDRVIFMRASVSFMRDEDFALLCEAVKALKMPFKLVMIDTVARVMAGVDMNEQQTVTLFMERCSFIGETAGAASLGVHHENKTGTMMGSIYFEANSDFVFEVKREGEEDGPLTAGEIVCTKMKDGEDRWSRSISYTKVQLTEAEDGPSSLVVEEIADASVRPKAEASALPDRPVVRQILQDIDSAFRGRSPLSFNRQAKRSGRYAPQVICVRYGVRIDAAEALIQSLLDNEILGIGIADTKTHATGLMVKNWEI